ncbi:MAG: hypothetical protein L3J69_13080 [Desulfobacula sp.]|nr:hypothetical protein [Desulfobacula sp.]
MSKKENRNILVIDETLREGMQYHGVMFSLEQRKKILKFQDILGVDICQAGYPSAHEFEQNTVERLASYAKKNKLLTRVAAMGRAVLWDAKILLSCKIKDLHFHIHIKNELSENELETTFESLHRTIAYIKQQEPDAKISIAMLDIGKSDPIILDRCVNALNHPDIDILSLPDTSGMMAPNQVFEKISHLSSLATHSKISIHCHNDLGMASANTIMGILGGGSVLEACALGIGERNGLADLFTTAKHLKDQGFNMRLNTDDIQIFKKYYTYVDSIVHEQTGTHLLTPNTPFFGDAVKTHVAGTHAGGEYGLVLEEKFYLNVLCGNHLVKKFLAHNKIDCPESLLDKLTKGIKGRSVRLNKAVSKSDIIDLIHSLRN